MMDFNHYTQKSLEAVQLARNLAVQQGQQQLEQIHLLSALLQQENGLIPQLLKKMRSEEHTSELQSLYS